MGSFTIHTRKTSKISRGLTKYFNTELEKTSWTPTGSNRSIHHDNLPLSKKCIAGKFDHHSAAQVVHFMFNNCEILILIMSHQGPLGSVHGSKANRNRCSWLDGNVTARCAIVARRRVRGGGGRVLPCHGGRMQAHMLKIDIRSPLTVETQPGNWIPHSSSLSISSVCVCVCVCVYCVYCVSNFWVHQSFSPSRASDVLSSDKRNCVHVFLDLFPKCHPSFSFFHNFYYST